MNPIHQELRPILEAISILSPAAFLFRGETVAVPAGPVQPIPVCPPTRFRRCR